MKIYPVHFEWREVDVIDQDGIADRRMAMVPQRRFDNICKRQYHSGEVYPLAPLETRSRASHSHFFACIHEGFANIPESMAARWPTPDHLRRWLLIETGWFHESEIDCASPKHATQAATLIRSFDGYARISIHGSKVIIRRAKSQSAAAMGKDSFESSKRDVLELLEHLIGTKRGELGKHAKRGVT